MTTESEYLQRIAVAAEQAKKVDEELRAAVAAAREGGDTWTRIATLLGTSRQAAQERYGDRKYPPTCPSCHGWPDHRAGCDVS